ncbi:hypothetical protein CWI75_12740 [Kineobactrum sediminis]|uniref:TonB-dependent receptor n=1 Tax=Kineobactrum sediminis TaxID=1905677 RepID=A0A2N5Y0N2_9GAMM|nr:TonB-dependent receptor [Kineobactrum sediminis]PLW81957.1 hypothetical protein CWI75_12740 [Kineobactrum sediminis]
MLKHDMWRPSAICLAIGTVLAAAGPVSVSAQGMVLEEVVVTARKRAESLQETPLAVTALDATALREAGVRNLADLNTLAPNIDVVEANGSAPLASVYIRGVGQRNTGENIDSGVGIYIDDVYLGRPDGALLDLNDIQSVQVLRGPQGTLFGKNTTGGALVFTTNRPVGEFEGSIGTRIGNFGRRDLDFVLNLPLSESVWTRFSGVVRKRDGQIENLFDGKDYMDEDRQSLIWQTRWAASEDLTIDLNVNWAETDQRMRPMKCLNVDGVIGWQAQLFNTLAIIPSTGKTLGDFCDEAAAAGGGDPRKVVSDLGGEYKAKNRGASLVAEWAVNDDLMLKSVSGWRYTEASQNDELDHTAIPFLHRTNTVHPEGGAGETDQYSQELQLIGSAADDRLQYVTGLYWFREESEGRQSISFLGPFDPAIANLFFLNVSADTQQAENDAFAAYAQLEWEFSPQWRTTLGVRYTEETRELAITDFEIDTSTLDANGGPVTPLGGGLFVVQRPGFEYNPAFGFDVAGERQRKVSNSDITPMASIQYLIEGNTWIDQGSLYLTYSEGFLSGGLSESPTGELERFEPEEVESWEFGFKLDLLDRRLRLNGAFFYTDYTNRQLTTLVINPEVQSPSPATINAAESVIKGFELESTWLATDNLVIGFNATITDGDIKEFMDEQITIADTSVPAVPGCVRANLTILQVDSCPNDRSSENLPRLAEQTYLLSAQYNWETAYGVITPRIQASWKFDLEFCFDALSCTTGLWNEDKQYELSARVGWVSPDERWSGSLFGTNLTDEEYLNGGTALVESSGIGGFAVAPPRMYGMELEYRF